MAENSTNNSKKNNKILAIIRVSVYTLAVMTILFIIAGVLSKYVFKETGTYAVVASEFYFESDYLTEEGATYDFISGTTSVSFELKNFPDDLRFASTDINYTVTVTPSNPEIEAPSVSSENGKLDGEKATTKVITLSNLKDGVSYDVSVLGEAGFEKTLLGTFNIENNESVVHKWVEDEIEYINLTVWVDGNIMGDAKITFPNTLLPDNTDGIMRLTKVGESVTDKESYKTDGSVYYGSHIYRFFKTDISQKYTAEDFTVKFNPGTKKEITVTSVKKPEK